MPEQDKKDGNSLMRLKRWQWVTILALAVGQALLQVAGGIFYAAGGFTGAVILFYLLAVLSRYLTSKIRWSDSADVFAHTSTLAAVLAMFVGFFGIPPFATYVFLLIVIYVPLQLFIVGGGLIFSRIGSSES